MRKTISFKVVNCGEPGKIYGCASAVMPDTNRDSKILLPFGIFKVVTCESKRVDHVGPAVSTRLHVIAFARSQEAADSIVGLLNASAAAYWEEST